MSYKVTASVNIDSDRINARIFDEAFGLNAATLWKMIIGPYTPRDTGRTEDEAEVEPWKITYNPVDPETGYHYGRKIYYGTHINFRKTKNPYATARWDQAAVQSGKMSDLYRGLNMILNI